MKTLISAILLLVLGINVSIAQKDKPKPHKKALESKEFNNYFVNGTVTGLSENTTCLYIATMADFNTKFGAAAINGAQTWITEADFKDWFALSLIASGGTKYDYKINSIAIHGTTLEVDYQKIKGEELKTWTGNFYWLALVKRDKFTKIKFIENGKTYKTISVK